MVTATAWGVGKGGSVNFDDGSGLSLELVVKSTLQRSLVSQRVRILALWAEHVHDAGFVTFTVEPRAAADGHNRLTALKRQLQSLGLAGALAYGILNTAYYTTAFLSIWIWAVGAPRGEVVAAGHVRGTQLG